MAPPMYRHLEFDPPLPAAKSSLVALMKMGSVIKTVVFFRTAFWRTRGFNGSVFSNIGPVGYSIDDTKPV